MKSKYRYQRNRMVHSQDGDAHFKLCGGVSDAALENFARAKSF